MTSKEPLCETVVFSLTVAEKEQLRRLAYERGATLSGLLRAWIRAGGPVSPVSHEMTDKAPLPSDAYGLTSQTPQPRKETL
jgi:hypothetical protein